MIITLLLVVALAWCPEPGPAGVLPVYIVGVEDIDYFPHYSFGEADKGYARAVLEMFAQWQGCRFIYRPLPNKRLKKEYFSGRTLDFLYPDNPGWTPDQRRGLPIAYSDPVTRIIGGTLVLPENKGRGLAWLKNLGVIRGFTPFHWNHLKDRVQFVEVHGPAALLRMVLAGRVDGADMEYSVARHLLKRMGQPRRALVVDPDLPHVSTHFSLSSIKHPELIKAFNCFLVENREKIQAVKARYGIVETMAQAMARDDGVQ